ncbi:unnamed protein product [Blepharisma stoltei]|uniref:EF-hand domain-containing protein n=1 Tax=Blepharisma stoltei TaxID=1481888 RepID=A0AAU9JQX2_9CILI|nr:unnamed protein product [Blepharisma stoltei]
MATLSKRLFESLEKLNEMGQLLLVANNISGISEGERNAFKELAIQKHPGMLAGLEVFKLDRNTDLLVDTWRRFIGETTPQRQATPPVQSSTKKPEVKEEAKTHLTKGDLAQFFSVKMKNKIPDPNRAADAVIALFGTQGEVEKEKLLSWMNNGGLKKFIKFNSESAAGKFIKNALPGLKKAMSPLFEPPKLAEDEIVKLRDIIGLGGEKPKVLVNEIRNKMGKRPGISLEEFTEIILGVEQTQEGWEQMRKKNAIKMLFEILDENKNGQLDNDEILNSVIILCGGSPEDKIEAVFTLYDVNGDGLISFDELLAHHTAAFKIMFAARPELRSQCGETPETLAQITVESIFQEIDVNNDRVITLPEFKAWYNKEAITDDLKSDRDAKIEAFTNRKEQLINRLRETKKHLTSPENIDLVMAQKEATGLGEVNVYDALRMFKEQNTTGFFSRQQFNGILKDLVNKYSGIKVNEEAFHGVASQLFLKFDNDGNGVVSMEELFCGLSVLCAGSLASKLKAAVECFDQSGDGELQFSEVVRYFKSVFNMLIPDDITDIKPSKIAAATAKNLFATVGANIESDGISYEIIKNWVDLHQRTAL